MIGSNFMESSPFLLLFVLGYCLAIIEGELRCYCNESGCVTTGYMCKSSAGKCFTAVEIRGEVTHLTHGCLDSIPQEHHQSCRVEVDMVSASRVDWTAGHVPVLLCCTEHMCNYREDFDVSIILTPKYNGTFHRGRAPSKEDGAIYSRNPHNNREEDRDLWFKAAVIAVPIAGGFILVLLVLLAVHMLRRDSRRHRRLTQIRHERSLTKAHMYISEHFSSKSTKHHCSLFNEKSSRTCVPLYSYKTPSNSHRSSSGCQSSYFTNILNSYCRNSLHDDYIIKTDFPAGDNPKRSSLIPCDQEDKNTSHMPCSTNIYSHIKNEPPTPCSFPIDSTFKNSNVMPEMSVILSKEGQNFHHFTRLVTSWPCSELGHQHLYSCVSEKTWQNGPEAVV